VNHKIFGGFLWMAVAFGGAKASKIFLKDLLQGVKKNRYIGIS
jgi:hypothetical protein